MNIKLLSYNNYYNRIVKKPTEDYEIGKPYSYTNYEDFEVGVINNANFNPADGVDTTQVINYTGIAPDYIVVTEEVDRIEVIHSRWFVIEATRTRNGQFSLVLHRDLAVDFYDEIADSTTFIEKATLESSDPAIFNSENMTYNQIKEDETLLKDSTKTAWIVGYLNPKYEEGAGSFDIDLSMPVDGAEEVNYLEDLPYIGDTTKPYYERPFTEYRIPIQISAVGITNYYNIAHVVINEEGIASWNGVYETVSTSEISVNGLSALNLFNNTQRKITALVNAINSDPNVAIMIGSLNSSLSGEDPHIHSDYEIEQMRNEDQKIYKVISIDAYEKAQVTYTLEKIAPRNITGGSLMAQAAAALLMELQTLTSDITIGNLAINNKALDYKYKYAVGQYSIEYNPYHNELSGTLDLANLPSLSDAPYKMFCMPYDSYTMVVGTTTLRLIGVASKIVANNLATFIGSNLYDIQLLPYCPLREFLDSTGKLNLPSGYPIVEIKEGDYVRTALIPCVTSNFSFDIEYNVEVVEPKVQSECDIYRLCSPNYSGIFEFNAAKNGGISKINVDCTYKPYSPYMHLNPDFKLLYGADYNDQRGLICGGDYSLPVLNDAWTQYQLNNKNYNNSFNRSIENMEIKNNVGLLSDIIGATTGAASAAQMGTIAGGAVGGVLGGIVSGVAGIGDVAINQALRKEEIDYTKDQFGYTLGNIKAQPQTLAKISSIDYNSKYYPFIEYYTCTDMEKQALRDKCIWDGMTVMRIGRLGDYIKDNLNYIKGKLININIHDDFHLVNAIAEELNKGLRYGGNE